ncbi:MAG: lipocalin family protein [Muribaculaceae bacterium]|nr:lipocalin family protein [Muribaculaceae bacterium]
MKKILLLMAIILPFVLTSCSKDKDEPQTLEQQLIGSWVGDVYDIVDGKVVVTHPHSGYILFNADHTGKSWRFIDGVMSPDYNFTWSLNGNILTMTYSASSSEALTYEISIKDDILHIKQGTFEFDYTRAKG